MTKIKLIKQQITTKSPQKPLDINLKLLLGLGYSNATCTSQIVPECLNHCFNRLFPTEWPDQNRVASVLGLTIVPPYTWITFIYIFLLYEMFRARTRSLTRPPASRRYSKDWRIISVQKGVPSFTHSFSQRAGIAWGSCLVSFKLHQPGPFLDAFADTATTNGRSRPLFQKMKGRHIWIHCQLTNPFFF